MLLNIIVQYIIVLDYYLRLSYEYYYPRFNKPRPIRHNLGNEAISFKRKNLKK